MHFEGIHHITCITADAPGNVDFYVRVLGLRLVKKSVNQDDPTVYHLFETARYIVLNPVRAGLCGTAADWNWSGYRKTMGMTSKGPELSTMLLYAFGRRIQTAREHFAAFIRAAE